MGLLSERISIKTDNDKILIKVKKRFQYSIVMLIASFFFYYVNLNIISSLIFVYAIIQLFLYNNILIDKQALTVTKGVCLFGIKLKEIFSLNIDEDISFYYNSEWELAADSIEEDALLVFNMIKSNKKYYLLSVRKQKTFRKIKELLESELKIKIEYSYN